MKTPPSPANSLLKEVALLWTLSCCLVLLIRFHFPLVYPAWVLPVALVYLPAFAVWRRGEGGMELGLAGGYGGSAARVLFYSLLLFIPFFAVAHVWRIAWTDLHWVGIEPDRAALFVLSQCVVVAFPEELFYRGYMQNRLNRCWKSCWRIAGADLGPGWLVTAALFVAVHALAQPRWWLPTMLGPALFLGWLKERSGGIYTGVLFHALANLAMYIVVNAYA